jgi:hypothetical protein
MRLPTVRKLCLRAPFATVLLGAAILLTSCFDSRRPVRDSKIVSTTSVAPESAQIGTPGPVSDPSSAENLAQSKPAPNEKSNDPGRGHAKKIATSVQAPETARAPASTDPLESPESTVPGIGITVFGGPRYLSINQSGGLGRANIGILTFESFDIKAHFPLQGFDLELELSSVPVVLKGDQLSIQQRYHRASAQVHYRFLRMGFEAQQLPSWSTSGSMEGTLLQTVAPSFGVFHSWHLPQINTEIIAQAQLNVPILMSSQQINTATSLRSGLGVDALVLARRKLKKKPEASMQWTLDVGVGTSYQSLSYESNWRGASGETRLSITQLQLILGLGVLLY